MSKRIALLVLALSLTAQSAYATDPTPMPTMPSIPAAPNGSTQFKVGDVLPNGQVLTEDLIAQMMMNGGTMQLPSDKPSTPGSVQLPAGMTPADALAALAQGKLPEGITLPAGISMADVQSAIASGKIPDGLSLPEGMTIEDLKSKLESSGVKIPAPLVQKAKTALKKVKTITCIKGKSKKVVTGTKCPKGYQKK